MHTNIFSITSNKYFIILIQMIHSICDNHLRKDDLMNYTVTNLRHLRVAQISLLTYYNLFSLPGQYFQSYSITFYQWYFRFRISARLCKPVILVSL